MPQLSEYGVNIQIVQKPKHWTFYLYWDCGNISAHNMVNKILLQHGQSLVTRVAVNGRDDITMIRTK